MAIEYPEQRNLSIARTSLGEIVRASDYRDIIGQCNSKYAVSGARVAGVVWPNKFQTTSGTFTRTDDNLYRDLDTWQPIVQAARLVSGQLVIQIRAYLQNAELQVDIIDATSGVTDGIVTLTGGASAGWVIAEYTATATLVAFGFQVRSTSGTASLWSIAIREAVLEEEQPVQSTEGTRGSYPRITLINTYPDGPEEFDSDYPDGYTIIT
jgi:hypothetical protein